jgi:hypothetical protein
LCSRFEIKSGYDSFCAVYGVRVMGSTMSGRSPMPVRKADIARTSDAATAKRRSGSSSTKRVTLDVVDSDLYPRHIASSGQCMSRFVYARGEFLSEVCARVTR